MLLLFPRRRSVDPPFAGFPLEIEFLIIDEFQRDIFRLRILCRVCRSWATYAQSLLFNRVDILHQTITPFLALLEERSHLANHINALHITKANASVGRLAEFHLLSPLPVLAGKLPKLNTLDFTHSSFGGGPDTLAAATWTAISRLHLHFCRFDTTDMMVELIASFPRLESLSVSQCLPAGILNRNIQIPSWRLRHLALDQLPPNAIIDWMATQSAELTVDSFRILSLGANASAVNALLSKIGGSLRHLELPWMYLPELHSPQLHDVVSLRPCTALTRVAFTERHMHDFGLGAITTLSRITSPRLCTVSFGIHLDQGYLDVHWEEIQTALMADAFSSLSAVVFDIWGGPFTHDVATPYERAVPLIKRRLALLGAKGLLQFKYSDNTANEVDAPSPAKLRRSNF
ncbi:hypothetical protein B0H16DRAFT_1901648 [Mycena metata]|uniref:F-box domain-containing protein n=1 Tax=Mycena metata TaxID=1033252 RepID=A0AAD7GW03_9AGAR|nr:hypothetical protein B0H16DRAFT_1901648 [Mycena metata]